MIRKTFGSKIENSPYKPIIDELLDIHKTQKFIIGYLVEKYHFNVTPVTLRSYTKNFYKPKTIDIEKDINLSLLRAQKDAPQIYREIDLVKSRIARLERDLRDSNLESRDPKNPVPKVDQGTRLQYEKLLQSYLSVLTTLRQYVYQYHREILEKALESEFVSEVCSSCINIVVQYIDESKRLEVIDKFKQQVDYLIKKREQQTI